MIRMQLNNSTKSWTILSVQSMSGMKNVEKLHKIVSFVYFGIVKKY